MKKRFFVLFITALIMLGIGGCKKTEQASSVLSQTPLASVTSNKTPVNTNQSALPSQTQPSKAPSASVTPNKSLMSTYQSVLQGKTQFLSVDSKKEINISQINQTVSDDSSVKAKVIKFAIVDLEKDNMPEVILWLSVNNNDYFGFEVLRYEDGVVYGYTLYYRTFMELKEDGTFSFSGGAADHGFGTVKFTKDGYTIDKITYCESSFDSENNQETISYFVNHKSATAEEFSSAIEKQSQKKDVTWYDFTDDNVKTLLSDPK